MATPSVKGFLGYVVLQKTAGSSVVTNGTEIDIPVFGWNIEDPTNFDYPSVVNADVAPTIQIQGGATPSITLSTLLPASTFLSYNGSAGTVSVYNLFNSLMFQLDSANNGDTYSILACDSRASGNYAQRVLDGCKCVGLSLTQNFRRGHVQVDMAFQAITAQGSTSFSSGSTTVAGQTYVNKALVDFGSSATADGVLSYTLNVIRGGSQVFVANGTFYASEVASGMIGGTFEIEQEPTYTASPGSTVTMRYGTIGSSTMIATAKLNLDRPVYPGSPSLMTIRKQYTLIDAAAGTIPVTFAT